MSQHHQDPVFTQEQFNALAILPFKTPYLERLLLVHSDLSDEFSRHLFEIAEQEALAYNAVMVAHGGNPSCVEFKCNSRESWAFVLPDASQPGRHRVQYFDACGFVSHHPYDSVAEATRAMVSEGFVIQDAGALDRQSSTAEWRRGTEVAGLIQLLNSKVISFEEFNLRRAAIA